MAETPEKKDETVEVPMSLLTKMQEDMALMERKQADLEAKNAGLEELFAKDASTEGGEKLREKKSFEPKFRTVRIRKYPIAGDVNNLGYVIGWTNRGAYQEVDRSGVSPQLVDYIDIMFYGQDKTKEGKLKAEKVRLLDLLNNGVQIHCKITDVKKVPRKEPTGEEIDVTVFDPTHGLVGTGDKIDGYTAYSDITYTIAIPGVPEPVEVDGTFVN